MKTEIVELNPYKIDYDKVEYVGNVIRSGGLVAFPTETVYGLGANALDTEAVKNIFKAKGRPSDNPLIVHISKKEQVYSFAKDIPKFAEKLMDAFWPGPLTLVMKKTEGVPDVVTGGLDTVAVRVPAHDIARAIIDEAKVPVAAPSANRSGKPSPTRVEYVIEDLDGRVDVIVKAGISEVGLESTVLDVTCFPPIILRPGGVLPDQIANVCGDVSIDSSLFSQCDEKTAPRSPGMKYKHYSPEAEVIVVKGEGERQVEKIIELYQNLKQEGKRVRILATHETRKFYGEECLVMGSRDNPYEIATNLFWLLRLLDEQKADVVLAEAIPEEGMGLAVMNRLIKAAGYRVE